MYENDGISALNTCLDNMMHVIEQKRNNNTFNSNHIICDLCGIYHATYECRQAQNLNYYDKIGHCTPYFDQYSLIGVILILVVRIVNVIIVTLHIFMVTNPNLSNMNLNYLGN